MLQIPAMERRVITPYQDGPDISSLEPEEGETFVFLKEERNTEQALQWELFFFWSKYSSVFFWILLKEALHSSNGVFFSEEAFKCSSMCYSRVSRAATLGVGGLLPHWPSVFCTRIKSLVLKCNIRAKGHTLTFRLQDFESCIHSREDSPEGSEVLPLHTALIFKKQSYIWNGIKYLS